MTDIKREQAIQYLEWLKTCNDPALHIERLTHFFDYFEGIGYRKGYKSGEQTESCFPRSAPYQN